MADFKILITGATGAGKTTAISAISDELPANTDVANTDLSVGKQLTTVGMDYGEFVLKTGDRIRLFGTPGQQRFSFIWQMLAQNAVGLIVLCDNSSENPLGELDLYLSHFESQFRNLPCVLGIGRLETCPHPSLDAYAAKLFAHGILVPVISVDVRQRKDVAILIEMLLVQIEADDFGGAV